MTPLGHALHHDSSTRALLATDRTREADPGRELDGTREADPGRELDAALDAMEPVWNPFALARDLFEPCYIGGWSAALHRGLVSLPDALGPQGQEEWERF